MSNNSLSKLVSHKSMFLKGDISSHRTVQLIYLTPGKTHSISKSKLAAVKAVVPFLSYGGET